MGRIELSIGWLSIGSPDRKEAHADGAQAGGAWMVE